MTIVKTWGLCDPDMAVCSSVFGIVRVPRGVTVGLLRFCGFTESGESVVKSWWQGCVVPTAGELATGRGSGLLVFGYCLPCFGTVFHLFTHSFFQSNARAPCRCLAELSLFLVFSLEGFSLWTTLSSAGSSPMLLSQTQDASTLLWGSTWAVMA